MQQVPSGYEKANLPGSACSFDHFHERPFSRTRYIQRFLYFELLIQTALQYSS